MSSHLPFSSEPARGWIPWRALVPVLAFLFVALPVIGFSPLLRSTGLEDAKHQPVGFAGMVAFLVVAFAGSGILVLLWTHFVERRSFATIGLGVPRAARTATGAGTLLRGHAIGIATACAVVAAVGIAGGYAAGEFAPAFGSAFDSGTALAKIALLLLCFVVQAGVEEILFRGWMLSAIARRGHPAVGVALSTLLFTFLHWGPSQPLLSTLSTILFALFTCVWALRAGNIWGVMGWHAGWNWMMGVGFEIPITGFDLGVPALLVQLTPNGPDYLTGGADGPESSIACNLFFAVATAWLLWRKAPAAQPASATDA